MRRPFVIVVAVFAVLLGAATLSVAQDATPEAMPGGACPAGTPEAGMATPEAEGMASPAAGAVTMASPMASPEVGCTVAIEGFAFSPATIEVEAGTTVTWTNLDSTAHTVTSDDGAFDSGDLLLDDSVSLTFEEPGTYTYHCDFHPNMTGTVIVT